MKKQVQAYFSGNVQGVGFRYTAYNIATKYPVSGFVKNLPNGKVEVIAEGEEKKLQEFMENLKSRMQDYISATSVNYTLFSGNYTGFKID